MKTTFKIYKDEEWEEYQVQVFEEMKGKGAV